MSGGEKRAHFVVYGRPQAKQRPRVVRRGHLSMAYTPKATADYEASIAAACVGIGPFVGPVKVTVIAVLPRPQRLRRKKDPKGLIWAPKRPDADNIRKAVLDGMAACWGDDAQVCAGGTMKLYAEEGGSPRTEVWVEQLTGDGPANDDRERCGGCMQVWCSCEVEQ